MIKQHVLRFPLILALLFLHLALLAQKELTLDDAVLKAGTTLAPERMKGLQWIEGTQHFSFIKDDRLMRGAIGKAADMPIVQLAELNAQLPKEDSLRAIPMIEWENADRFRFMHANAIWTWENGTLTKAIALPKEAAHHDIHEKTGNTAFTIEDDLYIAMRGSEKQLRVTSDGGNGIVNGKSVHREEYGITKGTFWSPSGEKLAFYRMDESMVTEYQLEDITTRPSTFKAIRYPMAGQPSHHVTIGIFDLQSGKTIFLKTGEPLDQYLTNISWDPSGKFIHVVHLDRATENLKVVRYDANSGEQAATLIEDHDDKYLEPQDPIEFIGNTGRYIWRSQRDGWPHLYLYDLKKGLVSQITKGRWVVKDLLHIDPAGKFLIVSGTLPIDPEDPKGALETHIHRVEIATGKSKRLTQETGTHYASINKTGSHIIDRFSSIDVAGRTVIREAQSGKIIKTLLDPKDPLDEYAIGSIELMTVAGENGTKLNARLIKPSDFDSTKKYPVIVYVYNGPHVQLIANARLSNAAPWMFAAAERGYLIWTVDGHGSAHRGRDFEQIIHRRLGEVEVRDQMHGVDHLRSLPFVDADRIAVHGWSYGGHMTTAMLTRHPGVFAVGVAGGPVMDWSMYEVMYTERYMDTPAENPDGYTSTALPPIAEKLKEDLLIITGGQDNVVLPQHGLTFMKNCIDAGIPIDFFEYPGHAHNVFGKDRLHLMQKILGYIDQRLQP